MKRSTVAALGVACSALAVALDAAAQAYPSRPVRLLIGFAPGGAADFVSRALADPMSRNLGQPIVVENRPGAGSSIAAEAVAKAAPDGYTILIASPSSIFVNPIINPKIGYRAMTDLEPVTLVSSSPLVVAVNTGTGIGSLKELIEAARKAPGKLNYATSGNGSAPHLAAAHFTAITGVQMVHVPFKGGGPAVQSVLAGDTQVTFATPPSVLPQVQAGRLRALAITSRESSPNVPGVPGMREAGLPEYEISFWYGIFVPSKTDAAIVARLHEAAAKSVAEPKVKEMFAREATDAVSNSSPAAFRAFLAEDAKVWSQIVKSSGARVD